MEVGASLNRPNKSEDENYLIEDRSVCLHKIENIQFSPMYDVENRVRPRMSVLRSSSKIMKIGGLDS